MMSLTGARRAVVPAWVCPVALPAAALDSGAPAPGARASADGAATADPAAAELAELAELADVAEHPASRIPPASMTPPIARAAAPNRVRLVRSDRRVHPRGFPMPGWRRASGGRFLAPSPPHAPPPPPARHPPPAPPPR